MMKQTEIGLIPDDWEVKKFSDLFDFCTTTILTENINKSFYVGTENMMPNKMGVTNNTIDLSYLNVREYKENDILVSNIRPYLKKIWLADKKGGCSSDVLVFRRKDKQSHPLFLYMLVSNDRFFQIVNDNAVGTKMPRGDKKIISEIQFALPSSKIEQQRIAKTLSDVDILISTTEKLIQKKKNIKQGTMQNLLTGKKRLPGFGPQTKSPTYKQTELGPIPEDWEVKKLETLCKNITDGSHNSPPEVLNGYYMPSVKDMKIDGFDFSECKKISREDYDNLVRNGCKPEVGDVLIAKDGSILKYCFAVTKEENIVILSSIAILKPKQELIDSNYLAIYFQQIDIIKKVIDNYKSGTGVPRIILNNFKNIPLIVPTCLGEQTAIANVLSSMGKEIETLNTKLEKCRNLKTAMMQQLLTGKIRLR